MIVLAPRAGESGVGDYADAFVAALRDQLDADVVELRHGPPGADRLVDIWRYRRRVHELVAGDREGTVVHAELSGGATPSFWSLPGLHVPRTATLHDAPRPVWFPVLTRGMRIARLSPVLVRLLNPFWVRVERRVMREVGVVTLSRAGAAATTRLRIGSEVRVGHLLAAPRSPIPPPWERPPAVGLFGHVYHGKGFGLIRRLREALPPDVALRVAGRGTERLPAVPGVDLLGPVEGADEDAYFASIRVLLLPYRRRAVGGLRAVAASAAQLQAAAYDTPSVAFPSPAMTELARSGGCQLADGPEELAVVAERLVRDDDALVAAHGRLVAHRAALTPASAVQPFLELWSGR